MVAKYKDNYYSCVLNTKEQILLTGIKSKAVFGFEEDGDIFYKNITQEELCDIFEVHYYVEYDSKLEHTPLWWEVNQEDFSTEGVYLYFTEGFLPDWEIWDKGICRKYITYADIRNCRVCIEYKRKNFERTNFVDDKGMMDTDSMLKLLEKYCENKL